jgi:hypothetical protein
VAQDGATPAAQLLPEAAAANRAVFYDGAGQPRTVAEIYRSLTGRIEREARDFAQDVAALPAPGEPAAGAAGAPGALPRNLGVAGLGMSEPMAAMLNVVALAALKLVGRSPATSLAPPPDRRPLPL